MGSHDGRVDHEVVIVRIVCEDLKDLFPDTRPRPASEALVDTLPVALAFSQACATTTLRCAKHPQTAVEEGLLSEAVRPRSPGLPASRSLMLFH
jgi:hypothetical protein